MRKFLEISTLRVQLGKELVKPLKRFESQEEIAEMVVFLGSPKSSFTTGWGAYDFLIKIRSYKVLTVVFIRLMNNKCS